MTAFRIIKKIGLDGREEFKIQQWRLFYWSSTYFYASGSANYDCSANTLAGVEALLQEFIRDTHEKRFRKPWNKITMTVKKVVI